MEQFQFTSGLKRTLYILMGVGALALLIGILVALSGSEEWTKKVWSGILVNNMFVLAISLAGLFFVAAHYLAFGGWYVVLKRVPEAMSMFLPYAGGLMLIIILGIAFHWHHIYHWNDAEIMKIDPIAKHKEPFLNFPFFSIRYLLYFGLWILFAYLLRRASLNEDKIGGLNYYNKSKVYSAIFIVIFAITSSTMSWDFIMSIDMHWYSTLFGWYNFATLFVSGIAVMILLISYLKLNGYLTKVTNEHMHDLGKFLFAFSIFWTYLWFSQYMLIWYSNLGEETIYFKQRIDHYPVLFYAVLIINFLVPFFALMQRNSKRKLSSLIIVSSIVLFGHWLDYFMMITPGATQFKVTLGIFELGLLVGYAGLFLFVFFNALSKAPMYAVGHPFYKESLQHHT